MYDYTISDYLLDRLAELGVGHVFGIPGDYTLRLLDHVVDHPDINWVGCTNELNAGYAADGYGRMRGIAALMTTFGVGELSAINALAGSYAEHVPVVHVVGAPSTGTQAAERIVHHSLGHGVFTQFLQMHEQITCARAVLNAWNGPAEIDRVLTEVRDHHLPGYLLVPADVSDQPASPPTLPLPVHVSRTNPVALAAFADAAERLLDSVDLADVAVLAGVLVHRLGAGGAMGQLLAAGPIRYATSLWGKSIVDESDPYYAGVYAGAASDPLARTSIEDACAVVLAGVQVTDLNSGFFTQQLDRAGTIELGASVASVGAATFAPVELGPALTVLARLVAARGTARPQRDVPLSASGNTADGSLTQSALWQTVADALRPGDIVVADQGTSFYGMATHRLPARTTFIGQPLWASIGYTLPALLGACLGAPGRRGILLIGDGAGQMTVSELSTIMRTGINATVVVVDNDGYTIERAIHGPEQAYNDIAHWDWTRLPAAFAPGAAVAVATASSVAELQAVLGERADGVSIIQAVVPRLDVPELLASLAIAASGANTRSA
jgi:alpha-keto-acid decarboxylase